MNKSIEDLNPEQTTLPLKIFTLLKFAWRIFFWATLSLMLISAIVLLAIHAIKITF